MKSKFVDNNTPFHANDITDNPLGVGQATDRYPEKQKNPPSPSPRLNRARNQSRKKRR